MKKRILSTGIIVFILAVLTITVSASNVISLGNCGTGVSYTIDSDYTLTISGNGAINNYNPTNYNNPPWEKYRLYIKSVVVENGVTSIGNYAFSNLNSLANVTLPDSVTHIGEHAFQICQSLTSIILPDSISYIGANAFMSCTKLSSINLPNGLESIQSYTFASCSSLESVVIPDSVIHINSNAFDNSGYYTNSANWENGVLYIGNRLICASDSISGTYEIKSGTKSIADNAFYKCKSLTGIIIPNSVKVIGDSAFSNCSKLADITIPSSVVSVGTYAFSNCTSLTKIVLPNSVTSLPYALFHNCTNLKSITLGNNLKSIDDLVFANTAFYKDSANWTNNALYIGNHLIKVNDTGKNSFTVKNGTKCIAANSFYGCSFSKISIPESITAIGNAAFYNCKNLTDVTIPSGVTAIGSTTFAECTALASIVIPDSVTSIGNEAFYNCSSLTSITIPSSVQIIGNSAFSKCSKLQSVVIPDSVTSMGVYAFAGCKGITNLVISNSLESINNYAFNKCTGLTSIIIPHGVKTIESSAFGDCNNLKSVSIPSTVTHINTGSFSNCYSLEKPVIPQGVLHIGNNAFYKCEKIDSIVIPDGVLTIGKSAFSQCKTLNKITIPDSVYSIGQSAFLNTEYYNDLNNWENGLLYINGHLLRAKNNVPGSFSIKSGTKYISENAFNDCTELALVDIPESVIAIYDNAFSHCTKLLDANINGTNTLISNNAFEDLKELTIHAKQGSFAETYAKYNRINFAGLMTWSLNNFKKNQTYTPNVFKDIRSSDWYYSNVASAYEYSIMNGKENNLFVPVGNITLAEVITAAVRINGTYHYGKVPTLESSNGLWYSPYIQYAKKMNALPPIYLEYDKKATRAEFAQILLLAINNKDLKEINNIPDGAIPDVKIPSNYANAVYTLYRAGILTGSDSKGSFNPDSTITRAEASAIITRIINPDLRKAITLP